MTSHPRVTVTFKPEEMKVIEHDAAYYGTSVANYLRWMCGFPPLPRGPQPQHKQRKSGPKAGTKKGKK